MNRPFVASGERGSDAEGESGGSMYESWKVSDGDCHNYGPDNHLKTKMKVGA